MHATAATIPLGTTFLNKLLRIDLPIKWQTFNALDDQNGNSIIEGEFYSKYNEDVDAAGGVPNKPATHAVQATVPVASPEYAPA